MKSWLKSYVVYLAVVMPLLVLDWLFTPPRLVNFFVIFGVVFGGLMMKDRIQRSIWP